MLGGAGGRGALHRFSYFFSQMTAAFVRFVFKNPASYSLKNVILNRKIPTGRKRTK